MHVSASLALRLFEGSTTAVPLGAPPHRLGSRSAWRRSLLDKWSASLRGRLGKQEVRVDLEPLAKEVHHALSGSAGYLASHKDLGRRVDRGRLIKCHGVYGPIG